MNDITMGLVKPVFFGFILSSVGCYMGLTTSGTIGARTGRTMDESVRDVRGIAEACKAVRRDVLVLCHGGPISEPADATYVLKHTKGIVGFFGASSIERLPTEVAITDCVRRFKAIQ